MPITSPGNVGGIQMKRTQLATLKLILSLLAVGCGGNPGTSGTACHAGACVSALSDGGCLQYPPLCCGQNVPVSLMCAATDVLVEDGGNCPSVMTPQRCL